MHELSIARSVVRTVAAAAEGQPVVRVRMRIGALSGVVPDAVSFAWDVATDDTTLAGAVLDVETVPVTVSCGECGAVGALEEPLPLRCRSCGSRSVEIVAGREVEVVSADVDDAAAAGRQSAPEPSVAG